MQKLSIVLLLIFFSISSLTAKDSNQKLSKEELLKKFLLLDKQEKNIIKQAEKKRAETEALSKLVKTLDKAKNQKIDK